MQTDTTDQISGPGDPDPARAAGHRGVPGAGDRITAEVTSWAGVSSGYGSRGEFAFKLGRREIGHIHGDHVLHIGFPKRVGRELRERGRVSDHPVFPGNDGWAARRIEADTDVEDVVRLLRLNYDRAVERHGLPVPEAPAADGFEPLLPGLLASDPASIFGGSVEIRSYLLVRSGRPNSLVYASPSAVAGRDAVSRLGGIEVRYLVHWHEAIFGEEVAGALGGELVVGAGDEAETAAREPVGRVIGERGFDGSDLELIPIPGHTPGSTALLWDSGSDRILFTGDSLMVDANGEWRVAVLDSSEREAYIGSLELIRSLDFDVLAPWAVWAGAEPLARIDRAERERRLDEVIARVRAGGDR
ncbi:DUF5519 family protein [Thermoleophilia bacterium SCSIO 60948]|nr:DUF5519 family protein [Thermoleophilia bacterium SCSIO 60948]